MSVGVNIFFIGDGVKQQHVQTSELIWELGSIWLMNICLTFVQKDALSFFVYVLIFGFGFQRLTNQLYPR